MDRHQHSLLLRAALALTLLTTLATPGVALAEPANEEALVEVVMASDLQCPFCARAHITIKQLREEYGAKVITRWLNQPLPFHQRAKPAAIAAEAARNQGKLDAFVDRVFEDYKALEDADLERRAREVGLDLARFQADLKDPATAERVERDIKIANAVGATGTPTFFINGRPLRGAQPIESFRKLIDEELAIPLVGSASQHRIDRLKAENAKLHGFLYGNVAPPAPETKPSAASDKTVYKVTVENDDPMLGDALAPVTLVVFGDYQCPFTRKLATTLGALRKKHGADLRVVHKQLPLSFHMSAPAAARAAVCANAQGRFEAMHDALLSSEFVEGQEVEVAVAIAEANGIDVKALVACMDDPKTQAKVDRDLALAGLVTARGTPNAFINGRKVAGARPIEEYEAVVAEELARAKKALDAGVAPSSLYGQLIAEGKVHETLVSATVKIDSKGAPRLGPAKAPIQVALFGDLQCPFTSRAFPMLSQIVDRFPNKVSVTFHHFPLDFHKDARPAAALAVCAQEQGRFWELATAIFQNQRDLPESLATAPETVGLDTKKLSKCLASKRPATLVDRQVAAGRSVGVRGTPSVFINGRKWQPLDGYGVDRLEATLRTYFESKLR
ncbi:MAG TPA: thioredoxin domain-containing protein [Myxococcota bacterium]|nr:thioredoxin domain-containing protein [Myxococcota bacterium]